MELIVLQGESNIGKTYTLNIAYQLLLQHGFVQVSGCFKNLDVDDFLDVLEHPETNVKVGIVTQSDNIMDVNYIKDSLSKLKSFQPRRVICSCTLGEGRDEMKKAIEQYPFHEIDKIVARNVSQQRVVNNWDANKIISHII